MYPERTLPLHNASSENPGPQEGSSVPFCTKHCHSPVSFLLALHLGLLGYKRSEPSTSKEVNTFGFLPENETVLWM